MNKLDLNKFTKTMKSAIFAAGQYAMDHQGKVANQGKAVEALSNDTDYVQRRRSAKTVIDEEVQEMLLQAAVKVLDPQQVFLDAEETTPTTQLFTKDNSSLSLIIDPVDGTLQYISGTKIYSINVGLVENGFLISALVYFPALQEFYFLDAGAPKLEYKGKEKKLVAPTKHDKSVFVNNRVDQEKIQALKDAGFSVTEDDGNVTWPEAILSCLHGGFQACLFHTPQVRDMLLEGIVSKIDSGYAVDWQGKDIRWPQSGRIDRIMFGFAPLDKQLLSL